MRKPSPPVLMAIPVIAFVAIVASDERLRTDRLADLANNGISTSATVTGTNCATRQWVRYAYVVGSREYRETGPAPNFCSALRSGDILTIRYSKTNPGTSVIVARARS